MPYDDDDNDDVFYCLSLRVPHCRAARAGPLTTHTTHLQRRTSTRFRSRSLLNQSRYAVAR
eukprot:SAG11_NODE_29826_length_306_cov_3.357488_1_plen_60_part_10